MANGASGSLSWANMQNLIVVGVVLGCGTLVLTMRDSVARNTTRIEALEKQAERTLEAVKLIRRSQEEEYRRNEKRHAEVRELLIEIGRNR